MEHGTEQKNTDDEDDDEEKSNRRGFAFTGPFNMGARFPSSVSDESKWIIRAIALAIALATPILAFLYGLSFIMSLFISVGLWIFTRNTTGH